MSVVHGIISNNERDKMDWENVIDWEVVNNLTDEQVSVILNIFDKGEK